MMSARGYAATGVSRAKVAADHAACSAGGMQAAPVERRTSYDPVAGGISFDPNAGLRRELVAGCMSELGHRRISAPVCPPGTTMPDMERQAPTTGAVCILTGPGGAPVIVERG